MTLYTESVADQTDHFANVFVRENLAYGCDDVMTFESTQPTPFCLDCFVCFVALRPKSTAMVMAGRSVHHILSLVTDNNPS